MFWDFSMLKCAILKSKVLPKTKKKSYDNRTLMCHTCNKNPILTLLKILAFYLSSKRNPKIIIDEIPQKFETAFLVSY